ncbi:MAG TPA: Ser-Thr-rich GPI-anchored membrane family protein [Methanoregulaceae archaeon]|nr:Ser-Thr-rich GPI-anchored membrane family protein [Methanoregulaceae archaeon]
MNVIVRISVWTICALLLLAALTATADTSGNTTSRVSVSTNGTQGNGASTSLSISADGRYVAFSSSASNLVPNDTNGMSDVFVHDRLTGNTSRVSVNSTGVQGDVAAGYGSALNPSISADGRYVSFDSGSTNLVNGDTNGRTDVFVHDRLTGNTSRVSVNATGVQGDGDSAISSISADGRYVAFSSSATNLVAGDTNTVFDVFVHDRLTRNTSRVSVSTGGAEGNSGSGGPSISADGRYVAFASTASNLVLSDYNTEVDIFVRDRLKGTTTLVSQSSSGTTGNRGSYSPSISADGRYIVFDSPAYTLIDGHVGEYWDVFVRDQVLGTTTLVSVNSSGIQGNNASSTHSLSPDGRYIAFGSDATNLVNGDTNWMNDIFIRDMQTGAITRVSVSTSGMEADGDSDFNAISAGGTCIAFRSFATNLVDDDSNGVWDIFVHEHTGDPTITLTNPNGGEVYLPGSTLPIHWVYSGSPGSMVRIELLQGTVVNRVLSSGIAIGTGVLGSYHWTIPGNLTLASDYRVRITSTNNSAYTDTSDAAFTIGDNPSITVVSPRGGETFYLGSPLTMSWTYTGDLGSTVNIEVLKGTAILKTLTGISIGSSGSGSYNVTIPASTPLGSNYTIRVTSASHPEYTDTSDGPFTIAGPTILVTVPNGGETFHVGSTLPMNWTYHGNPGSTVNIEVIKGGATLKTLPGIPIGSSGSGSYSVTIPASTPLGTDYKIRVTSASTPTCTDTSNGSFAIGVDTSSSITVQVPNGGENWVQGSLHTLRWTYAGTPGTMVMIEALRGETVLAVITPGTPLGSGGSGSYNLTFPYNTPLASDYRIRVSSTSIPAYSDTSDYPFTISSAITVATPNGGEEYKIGSSLPMSWTYTGTPGSLVNIDVIKGGAILKTLTGVPIGPGGSGSYNVTIPAGTPVGPDYTIRVTSGSYATCTDTSNGTFAIRAAGG